MLAAFRDWRQRLGNADVVLPIGELPLFIAANVPLVATVRLDGFALGIFASIEPNAKGKARSRGGEADTSAAVVARHHDAGAPRVRCVGQRPILETGITSMSVELSAGS
jgi:hypothetical protein